MSPHQPVGDIGVGAGTAELLLSQWPTPLTAWTDGCAAHTRHSILPDSAAESCLVCFLPSPIPCFQSSPSLCGVLRLYSTSDDDLEIIVQPAFCGPQCLGSLVACCTQVPSSTLLRVRGEMRWAWADNEPRIHMAST